MLFDRLALACAPEGLPALTVQMDRANPFDETDGLGDGKLVLQVVGGAIAVTTKP